MNVHEEIAELRARIAELEQDSIDDCAAFQRRVLIAGLGGAAPTAAPRDGTIVVDLDGPHLLVAAEGRWWRALLERMPTPWLDQVLADGDRHAREALVAVERSTPW